MLIVIRETLCPELIEMSMTVKPPSTVMEPPVMLEGAPEKEVHVKHTHAADKLQEKGAPVMLAEAIIYGLKNSPELNGTVGAVTGYDEASERFIVHINGDYKKLKKENLIFGDNDDMSDEDYDEDFNDFGGSVDKNRLGCSGAEII